MFDASKFSGYDNWELCISMENKGSPQLHFVNTILSEGEAVIFLGAGSSLDGWQGSEPFPSFSTLIERVLEDEGIEYSGDGFAEFLDVIKRWEEEADLPVRLSTYLYGSPGISHLQLASATMSLFPQVNMSVFLTTNYDDLMFKALSSIAKKLPERDPRTFSLNKSLVVSEISKIFSAIPSHSRKGTPIVLKLFGDLGYNFPIFHEADMRFDEFTHSKLLPLLEKPVLFIGYSLRDAPILKLIASGQTRRPVFIVSPTKPNVELIEAISQRRFYCIEKTFSEFVADFIEINNAKDPSFAANLQNLLKSDNFGLFVGSANAIVQLSENASVAARARYLNRQGYSNVYPIVRRDTGPNFQDFLKSSAGILGILGESGCGKSTIVNHFIETQQDNAGLLTILYDSESLQSTGSLSAKLAVDLMVDTKRLKQALAHITTLLERANSTLLVFVDALNESAKVDPTSIRYELEELATEFSSHIKFGFTCRRAFWNARMDPAGDFPSSLYFHQTLFELPEFSEAEAEIAFQKYKYEYDLKSDYASLSSEALRLIRDPLLLKLVSVEKRGREIPRKVNNYGVLAALLGKIRKRYLHTALLDYLETMVGKEVDEFLGGSKFNGTYTYREMKLDPNLALLAQQQLASPKYGAHPLYLLEDENIITPIDSAYVRFRFTSERFHEYIIARHLAFTLFSDDRAPFRLVLQDKIREFRNAHYGLYQGLISSLVIKYIETENDDVRKEILKLRFDGDPAVADLAKIVIRELIFRNGIDADHLVKVAAEQNLTRLELLLDAGFDLEAIFPYAVAGVFDKNVGIRRLSTLALQAHMTLDKVGTAVRTKAGEIAREGNLSKQDLGIGFTYLASSIIVALDDKTAAFRHVADVLREIVRSYPNKIDMAEMAQTIATVALDEGPLLFGANYSSESISYPWSARSEDFERYRPRIRQLLGDPSPEALIANLDVILFFSKISELPATSAAGTKLFAYQFEYRIVQWLIIRAWAEDSDIVIDLLDAIAETIDPFCLDFTAGIMEFLLIGNRSMPRAVQNECYKRLSNWISIFERNYPKQFYQALDESDPFSYNLVPLAVLARAEAHIFPDKREIPCLVRWLESPSEKHKRMALLAANWLASEFPQKTLKSLDSVVGDKILESWLDVLLSGFEVHSPLLLDEFFEEFDIPLERQFRIRTSSSRSAFSKVQYRDESIYSWIFLGPQSRLSQLSKLYEELFQCVDIGEFFEKLLRI